MQADLTVLENGVKLIRLVGRLDMAGAGEIDIMFTSYAATEKAGVVVDLSGVNFLASIGPRIPKIQDQTISGKSGHRSHFFASATAHY